MCWHSYLDHRCVCVCVCILAEILDKDARMWDLIVSVPDHCLSFNFGTVKPQETLAFSGDRNQSSHLRCLIRSFTAYSHDGKQRV